MKATTGQWQRQKHQRRGTGCSLYRTWEDCLL